MLYDGLLRNVHLVFSPENFSRLLGDLEGNHIDGDDLVSGGEVDKVGSILLHQADELSILRALEKMIE